MKKLKLISPDDGTTLKKIEGAYVDGSKNLYPIENGVNYLVPKKTIKAQLNLKLINHQYFREFKFKKTLQPLRKDIPQDYDMKSKNILRFIPKLKDKTVAYALDHGCGSGALKNVFISEGYEYIGVDNEIGVSTHVGGGRGFKNGASHICDLHSLPFADNSFKFAVSYSVFEHLQNPLIAAKELYRVMEENGTCFIAIGNLVPFHMDSFFHMTHYGVLNLFKSAGFEIMQIAGANWNGYEAISSMGGLPGPKIFRKSISKSIVKLHESLWRIKRLLNGDINTIDEITRHNMMAGLIKAVIRKQKKL